MKVNSYLDRIKEPIQRIINRIVYVPKSSNSVKFDEVIEIKNNNIRMINKSTFKVFEIEYNKKIYYFREIKRHLYFKDYLINLLNNYYRYCKLDAEMIRSKEKIYTAFLKKNTLRKLYNMGYLFNESSMISAFFRTLDYNIFDICELNYLNKKNIINLLQFLWGEIFLYKLNVGLKIGFFETSNSNKELATKKLAELLSIGHLVPETKIVKLIIDGIDIKYGTLMDQVQGISPHNLLENEKQNYNANFIKDCISLNILDALATEKDHRPGNYYVKFKNDVIDTLQVFDNDSPKSFSISSSINLITYMGCGPLINRNNVLNYNFIDKSLYKNIIIIQYKSIESNFNDCLTLLQKYFLWLRIKKMKKVLNKSFNNGLYLLEQNDWNKIGNVSYSKRGFVSYLEFFVSGDYVDNDFDINNILKR